MSEVRERFREWTHSKDADGLAVGLSRRLSMMEVLTDYLEQAYAAGFHEGQRTRPGGFPDGIE
jgi:hypothetical protein